MGRRGRRERGFTLLEVLVGLAVLAIGMTTILGGIATALRGVAGAEAEHLMTVEAQSLLATVGQERPLEPGRQEGRSMSGRPWTLSVTAFDDGQLPVQGPVVPYLVEVVVEDVAGGGRPALVLTTLRLGPRT